MDTTPHNPGQDPYGVEASPGTPETAVPTETPVGPAAPDSTAVLLGPEPPAEPPAAPKRRLTLKRKGVAVVVAAALAAGLVGGAAGGLIGNALDDSPSASSSYSGSGTAPVTGVADQNLTGVAAVAKAVLPSVVEITVTTRRGTATGSGVILSPDGKILTNAHVVSDGDGGTITVKFSDGSTAKATVLGSDTDSDLAVIKAENVSNLKAATLGDSDSVAIGDTVVAIGSPEGLTGTVTSGIVSALNREVEVASSDSGGTNGLPFGSPYGNAAAQDTTTYKAIQTDASINPGNSGGPLIDMNGRIIGINSAIYSPTSGGLGTDAGSVGLGFAIPVNQVKALLTDLENGKSA
jgi:putative serine protease PepD